MGQIQKWTGTVRKWLTNLEKSPGSELSTGKALSTIKKESGERVVLLWLEAKLITLNDLMNVTRGMTQQQIVFTAQTIYEDYFFYNQNEISLIFKRIVTGHYPVFEGLDTAKVLEAFRKYDQERSAETSAVKVPTDSEPFEVTNQMYQNEVDKVNQEKKKKKEKPAPKPVILVKSEHQLKIDEWFFKGGLKGTGMTMEIFIKGIPQVQK